MLLLIVYFIIGALYSLAFVISGTKMWADEPESRQIYLILFSIFIIFYYPAVIIYIENKIMFNEKIEKEENDY